LQLWLLPTLSYYTLPWCVLKVREEGNNAIVNMVLKLLFVHAPFPIHPNGVQPFSLLLTSKCNNLKQSLFLSSALTLNGSYQCTGTHCPVVLLLKMPVSYAMTLQNSILALVGKGCGIRLLVYHPLFSYSHQQRYPSRQCLVSSSPSHPTMANPS
jgi:hypothetical protein